MRPLWKILCNENKKIVIYSKSEEGKAFVHANCVFVDDAIQVNESSLILECCI
jgi:hypothetical protein